METMEAIEIKLNESAIKLVRSNLSIRNRIQYELNLSPSTLARWVRDNDPKLATGKAMSIISEESNLPSEKLLLQVA